MKGLFISQDTDGITFLRFYADGNVIAYGKSTRFDQVLPSFPWFRVESDKILFASGIYLIEEGNRIRIRVTGKFGKINYRGTIHSDTLKLFSRCPITNYGKSETFIGFLKSNTLFISRLTIK